MDRVNIDAIKKIPWIWYLISVAVAISLVIFNSVDYETRKAKRALDAYELTSVCSDGNVCKQNLLAIIKKVEIKDRSTSSAIVESDTINFLLEDQSLHAATITPNISAHLKDDYMYTSNDINTLNRIFPNEKEMMVEMWRGQITAIFTNSNPTEKETTILTANHPLIIFTLAQRNTNDWLVIEFFVLVLTIFLAFVLRNLDFQRGNHVITH